MSHCLVLGAGAQGTAIAASWRGAGGTVRTLSRRPATADRDGWEAHVGDLTEPAAVRAAFAGIRHAVLTLPLEFDPAVVSRIIDNVIDAAEVELLVYNTANRLPDTMDAPAAFTTRRRAAEALLASRVPTVVLRPSIYLDNLLAPRVRRFLEQGVLRYPLPADIVVTWSSLFELGEATTAALRRPDLAGTAWDLGSTATLDGPGLAAALSATTSIRYEPDDPTQFESSLAPWIGARNAVAVADTYRWVPEHRPGLYSNASASAVALGVPPTGIGDWLSRVNWGRP